MIERAADVRMMDGNEAAARVAYRMNEVIAIYPITPASPMGELADEWAAWKQPNLWGGIPRIVEMQSEAGAAGTVHGSLQAGAMTTTFTASQGLLLMIPNLYKIAGELTSFCIHVAARTVATHALSIFADHSDVMACRQTGFAMLASANVQEAQDFACIGQVASLRSRVPFMHFFDGFRTSHEINEVSVIPDDVLKAMVPAELVRAHRQRALTPDNPLVRGAAQNPDTFFQAREACNPFYTKAVEDVVLVMDDFAARTGRKYRPFDYHGDPDAERVVVLMGSGAETARETVEFLSQSGEKVGVVVVRLYRPFSVAHFLEVLPSSVKDIAVLDRTKEPGSVGEPLFLDVIGALHTPEAAGRQVRVIGGRYGLSSKEFTPAMVKAVFDALSEESPQPRFTVGITDDVTHLSLPVDDTFTLAPEGRIEAIFFGLGSDGTVGANKNTIKIIGEQTDHHAQGYFVYDSKKAGAVTVSHLRFGPDPIEAPYLVQQADFVACHQFQFLDKFEMVERAKPGAVFLLNSSFGPEAVWTELPLEVRTQLLEKKCKLYVIDAYAVARETGMGRRINTIMQTCFFAISGVLPREQAIAKIEDAIRKTYEKKGREIIERNIAAVNQALDHLSEVSLPGEVGEGNERPPAVHSDAPDFVKQVTAVMMAGHGDRLPVSAFPPDGTWPVATTKWEKRNIAQEIPEWDPKICIQCNKCAFVCPHAAIRTRVYPDEALSGAPDTFQSVDSRVREYEGWKYTVQVAPEDCTGCTLCVQVCPAKDRSNPRHKAIDMVAQAPIREREVENYDFFLDLPPVDRTKVKPDVRGVQLLDPLFEYSGACPGCGETPYIKLLTQLYGDRLLIANATGCSSIYGGNLPTTPYCTDAEGRGPAWSNSLFEDNAEFGLGFRLAVDQLADRARILLDSLGSRIPDALKQELLSGGQTEEEEIQQQRARVVQLRDLLASIEDDDARELSEVADYLVEKSVWLVGGDGWAYDIGYGGLDHVLSMNHNVNILILDTEVYSNTGGQASKATPLAAAAKFAASGKSVAKKDIGMMAMSYGHVYVAHVAFGAKDAQTLRAFREAASWPGPSLIIAYSHCIAHGYDLAFGLRQQELAVRSGVWPLFRFDPRRADAGEPPLVLDSGPPRIPVADYMRNEARFRVAERLDRERFKLLLARAQQSAQDRFEIYEQLAGIKVTHEGEDD